MPVCAVLLFIARKTKGLEVIFCYDYGVMNRKQNELICLFSPNITATLPVTT